MTENKSGLDTVDAQTFGSVMGQAVWLMTMSKAHRDKPISLVEDLVAPAILLKQFRLFSKGKQPVAFLVWASVSDDVRDMLAAGGTLTDLKQWRSGANIVVVDCVSPFSPKEKIIESFYETVASAEKTLN